MDEEKKQPSMTDLARHYNQKLRGMCADGGGDQRSCVERDAEKPQEALEAGYEMKLPSAALSRVSVQQGTAEGGASFEYEIRWAIDCIQRGDTNMALDRLKRILK